MKKALCLLVLLIGCDFEAASNAPATRPDAASDSLIPIRAPGTQTKVVTVTTIVTETTTGTATAATKTATATKTEIVTGAETVTASATVTSVSPDGGTAPDADVKPDTSAPDTFVPDAVVQLDLRGLDGPASCVGVPDGAQCSRLLCDRDATAKYATTDWDRGKISGVSTCESGVCVPHALPTCANFRCGDATITITRQEHACESIRANPGTVAFTLIQCPTRVAGGMTWPCPDAAQIESMCKVSGCVPI